MSLPSSDPVLPASTCAFRAAELPDLARTPSCLPPIRRRPAAAALPRPAEFYDLSPEDLAQAKAEWARNGDDWFAHAYELAERAEHCAARITRLCTRRSRAGRILGNLCALPWRYERAALTAQAHQAYVLAVAQRKGHQPGTAHDPDAFRPDPALMARAQAILFRRINIAHGHAAMYPDAGA